MKEHGRRILGSLPVDCLLLGAVAVLTCFPYITGLGFYGDDWGVLGVFGSLTDHFFGRLFSLLAHHHLGLSRPGQMLYMALQYKVFGFQPIGYHVVNTAVLALGAILFYLTLRQLGQDRLIALSVGLVFSLLPHFSTTRFWYAASQGNLSLAFYFLSLRFKNAEGELFTPVALEGNRLGEFTRECSVLRKRPAAVSTQSASGMASQTST